MYTRGYIRRGSVDDAIRLATAAEIKDVLIKYGLRKTWNRAVLEDTLRLGKPQNELEAILTKAPHRYKEKGDRGLKEYDWIQ